MADRNGSICGSQEVADRAPHYVTAPQYYCFFACGINPTNAEQLHHTLRRTGDEKRFPTPFSQFTNVDSPKTVHILFVSYGRGDRMFGNMLREGKLDEDAVHRWVVVCFGDFMDDLKLRDGLGEVDDLAKNICLAQSDQIS